MEKHSIAGFVYLEHTADIKFQAFGRSLSEAFGNAARAVFNAIAPLNSISPLRKMSFSISAGSVESLLYDFLDELLFLHDSENMLFSRFDISIKTSPHGSTYSLGCDAFGERFDASKHSAATDIKAMTYHDMSVEKKGSRWVVQAVVDV
jgi:SHS2 domain-containing protein